MKKKAYLAADPKTEDGHDERNATDLYNAMVRVLDTAKKEQDHVNILVHHKHLMDLWDELQGVQDEQCVNSRSAC